MTSVLLTGSEIGLELISREIAINLIQQINPALDAEDLRWNTLDAQLDSIRGVSTESYASEHVSPINIHVGHKPSLIIGPVENYPNIAVMSYAAGPSTNRPIDQGEDFQVRTSIETCVKAGPYDPEIVSIDKAEELVNKRIQRMVEAIHFVVSKEANIHLNGLITGYQGAPAIVITDCDKRSGSSDESNTMYYWQMARIEYTIFKPSVF